MLLAHGDIPDRGCCGDMAPLSQRSQQLSQGGRCRQGPALAALSWLCLVLSAPVASPDLLSLADVTATEGRARGVSWVAP